MCPIILGWREFDLQNKSRITSNSPYNVQISIFSSQDVTTATFLCTIQRDAASTTTVFCSSEDIGRFLMVISQLQASHNPRNSNHYNTLLRPRSNFGITRQWNIVCQGHILIPEQVMNMFRYSKLCLRCTCAEIIKDQGILEQMHKVVRHWHSLTILSKNLTISNSFRALVT